MDKKNVTFADIAAYTHFSKTTISRYFNNPDSLTIKNQDIIAQALIDLNYQENKLAKVLANGKSEFIGIIIPNLYLHYYSEMLNQILLSYERYGYKFMVFVGNDNEETERQYIQELLAYKIEGLIILSHTISSRELSSYNIPLVVIEREDQFVSSVTTDNYFGAAQAASVLYKNHCDVLIHINVPVAERIPAYNRIRGFVETCKEHNLNYELFLEDLGNSYEDNNRSLSSIFDRIEKKYPGKRKGIFLANDTYANIFLNQVILKHGKLPDDYRIIGFDNSPISKEAIIPISTIGQQIDKIAWTAMDILVDQMNDRKKRRPKYSTEIIHKQITPILVRRSTTDRDLLK